MATFAPTCRDRMRTSANSNGVTLRSSMAGAIWSWKASRHMEDRRCQAHDSRPRGSAAARADACAAFTDGGWGADTPALLATRGQREGHGGRDDGGGGDDGESACGGSEPAAEGEAKGSGRNRPLSAARDRGLPQPRSTAGGEEIRHRRHAVAGRGTISMPLSSDDVQRHIARSQTHETAKRTNKPPRLSRAVARGTHP